MVLWRVEVGFRISIVKSWCLVLKLVWGRVVVVAGIRVGFGFEVRLVKGWG